ncbi:MULTISPECIES: hypothetical protein [Vibrio harveyi group]|uniref:hypothetical protein n=1 Tax=Vibrio harveyi group TaxID=717610 RepID=UPI0006A5F503|nr:hypothetical protein [Vibrio diabolicus]KOE95288.1 hypothetical protein ACS91_00685 [Vibrio parahaemolyticus]MCS0310868.1 hypothetical protein [Vibrio diabolicus]
MTTKIDMNYASFCLESKREYRPTEPDDHFEESTLTINASLLYDDEDSEEFDDFESVDVATINFLSLDNYQDEDIHLFFTFDAHSQLACNAFEYVNHHKRIIEKKFSQGLPIIFITSIDVEDIVLGSELEVIKLANDFFRKRFGDSYFCFGLASQFFNYNDEENAVNKESMIAALKAEGFSFIMPAKGLSGTERVIPVFR